jgi:hypothetical protein
LTTNFIHRLPIIGVLPGIKSPGSSHRDSEQVRLGAQEKLAADSCQLSDLNKAPDPLYPSDQFIDLVRFEGRYKLDELPDDWKKVGRDVLFK